MNIRRIIDWVSFTVHVEEWSGKTNFNAWVKSTQNSICQQVPSFGDFVDILPEEWETSKGRSGYSLSYRNKGVAVYMNPRTPHALVEISGVGCQIASHYGYLLKMMKEIDVTRIDIAVDIESEIAPTEVVKHYMVGNKMRSRSTIKSDTGETVYIGSRKSDRYMRIYRYNDPHPRSKFLRFEFVARKKYAQHIRSELANGQSLEAIINGLADSFQIKYPGLTDGSISVKIPGIRGNTSQNKTERWLLVQAIPALKKLAKEGHIEDLEMWVRIHILDDETDDE